MVFDSIIFDMDGTLVHMVDEVAASWNKTCSFYGWNKHFSSKDIQSIMGLNALEIGKILFSDVDENEGKRRVEICCDLQNKYFENHKGKCFIPNRDFLEKLSQKFKLYIVSNCLAGYIEVFLKNYNYENFFIDFANSSRCPSKAENIKYIVSKHNLKKPVYVGDTNKDYLASKEANVTFIHSSYGYGKVDCEFKINSIEELLDY